MENPSSNNKDKTGNNNLYLRQHELFKTLEGLDAKSIKEINIFAEKVKDNLNEAPNEIDETEVLNNFLNYYHSNKGDYVCHIESSIIDPEITLNTIFQQYLLEIKTSSNIKKIVNILKKMNKTGELLICCDITTN